MKFKSFLLVFLTLLLFVSCKNRNYVDQLTYEINIKELCIKANAQGEPAAGEYWSRDGKSYKVTVKEGKIADIEYYTNAGKLFCRVVAPSEKHYFNAKGNEISAKLAKSQYKAAYDEFIIQQKSLSDIVRGVNKD